MNKLTSVFGSIALSSVIFTSVSHSNTHQVTAETTDTSSLSLVANGEDFVRQGFVSKDGWQIDFEKVYVNLASATAYAVDATFNPQKGDTKSAIDYQEKVNLLEQTKTVDLAEGEAEAAPILVSQSNAPENFYNALSFQLDTAGSDSAIAGKTIALIGTASKNGETVNFNLGFNRPIEYVCGEFIGDERQGIVTPETSGKVEATFHFDHIFGDADTPATEALNQDALGFQPLATLASNGTLEMQDTELAEQLSASDYQKLSTAIASLGHVGEGHCVINEE